MPDYDWNTTKQIENVNYAKGGWLPFTDQHNILIHVESVNPQWAGEKIRKYRDNGVDYKTIVLYTKSLVNIFHAFCKPSWPNKIWTF